MLNQFIYRQRENANYYELYTLKEYELIEEWLKEKNHKEFRMGMMIGALTSYAFIFKTCNFRVVEEIDGKEKVNIYYPKI